MSNPVMQQASTPPWDRLPDEQQIVASWQDEAGIPVVSVLCHAYNQAEYLHDALAGILRQQTNFPFEVVVRDDASTDGTSEIVRLYAERYPRIIRPVLELENRYCQGVKPIAATFPLARGEFVAFCEGDDYWLGHDKLQQQVNFMRAHPECGLVHSNYLNLIHVGGKWRTRVAFRNPRQLQHRSGRIYAAMLAANRIQTCTALCRRSLIADHRRAGPGVDGYMVGDWPLFLYLAHKSDVGFSEVPLSIYRRTPGSVTNSGHQAAVTRCLDAIRMVGDFCDYFEDDDVTRQSALVAQYGTLLWLTFRAGDTQRFWRAWAWLAQHYPVMLTSMRARIMRALIGMPVIRNAALHALGTVESILHCIRFRSVDTREAR